MLSAQCTKAWLWKHIEERVITLCFDYPFFEAACSIAITGRHFSGCCVMAHWPSFNLRSSPPAWSSHWLVLIDRSHTLPDATLSCCSLILSLSSCFSLYIFCKIKLCVCLLNTWTSNRVVSTCAWLQYVHSHRLLLFMVIYHVVSHWNSVVKLSHQNLF